MGSATVNPVWFIVTRFRPLNLISVHEMAYCVLLTQVMDPLLYPVFISMAKSLVNQSNVYSRINNIKLNGYRDDAREFTAL